MVQRDCFQERFFHVDLTLACAALRTMLHLSVASVERFQSSAIACVLYTLQLPIKR